MTRRRPPHRPRSSSTGRLPVLLYAHPFELAFGLILLLIGLRAAGLGDSTGRTDAVPEYVRLAVIAAGTLGGAGIIIGLIGRAHALARAIEKAGLYFVAGAFGAYTAALLLAPGNTAVLTALIQGTIGAACFLRAEAIRLTERIVLEQLRAHNNGNADPTLIRDLVDGTHHPRRLGRRRGR